MAKMVTPMDLALAGMRTWRMQTQSAAVIGLRMAGMAGAWAMPPTEYMRMVTEKQAAFSEAGRKMALAMMTGAAPLAVYGAGLAPVGRKTAGNSRRLTRRALRS
jgi:hypothetical protein